MDIIKKFRQFISYWYVRYLLATELYMVDTWERAVVHALFAVIFVMFWCFNYSIVMSGVTQLRSTMSHVELIL